MNRRVNPQASTIDRYERRRKPRRAERWLLIIIAIELAYVLWQIQSI